MGRRRSGRIDFHKPLSTPDSKVVFHCYASHGKGFGKVPPWNSALRVLAFRRDTREVQWVDALYTAGGNWHCDELRGKGWVRLGWTMADDSLPLGELDAVDSLCTKLDCVLPLTDERDCTWRQYGHP